MYISCLLARLLQRVFEQVVSCSALLPVLLGSLLCTVLYISLLCALDPTLVTAGLAKL